MCDQDHFENDRQKYEALGLVTRKQFGVMLGAGIAMMLPKVANAVTVTEIGRERDDAGRHARTATSCIRRAARLREFSMWPDIFGLRPAFRQMGKRLAESGYSVLVVNPFYRVKKAPTAEAGAATPIQELMPLARALNETTHMTDAKSVHRVAGPAIVGCQESEDRHAGLLHGRPDGVSYRGRRARSRRSSCLIPWRRTGDRCSQTARTFRPRRAKAQFLIAIAANDDARSPNEKTVLKETFAKANLPAEIEVYAGAAHGWCPPDSRVYNEPQAEKAWSRLLALYRRALI